MKTRTPEGSVSDSIRAFMRSMGWRAFRQQSGMFTKSYGATKRFVRIGEDGLPDFRFERYFPAPGFCLTLYVEVKSQRGSMSPKQVRWINEARNDGAAVIVAKSIDSFREQYLSVFGWLHDAVSYQAVADAVTVFARELKLSRLPMIPRRHAAPYSSGSLFEDAR